MAILPIITGKDHPILRAKTKKVEKVTKAIKTLIRDMAETMEAANGVGLAAPQVGQSLRLCLAPIGGKITALIDPKITKKSAEKVIDEEGCLSLPHVWLPITRSKEITVTYIDGSGKKQERKLANFEARVVQHEVDHLDGILIVDYAQEKLVQVPDRRKTKVADKA
jgi:peptide deformylase